MPNVNLIAQIYPMANNTSLSEDGVHLFYHPSLATTIDLPKKVCICPKILINNLRQLKIRFPNFQINRHYSN